MTRELVDDIHADNLAVFVANCLNLNKLGVSDRARSSLNPGSVEHIFASYLIL